MKQALADSVITVPAAEARAKVAEYLKAVRQRHDAEDQAILRGYKALAKGHQVIDLPAVIRAGGVFEQTGLPRIAIATADHEFVRVDRTVEGRVVFSPEGDPHWKRTRNVYRCPVGTLPDREAPPWGWGQHNGRRVWVGDMWRGRMRAMVPHVPPALRPLHSLSGYQMLFEVDEWAPDPAAPSDPALLKHLGGDLYAVLAVWDLTPLEQSVLMGRIRQP